MLIALMWASFRLNLELDLIEGIKTLRLPGAFSNEEFENLELDLIEGIKTCEGSPLTVPGGIPNLELDLIEGIKTGYTPGIHLPLPRELRVRPDRRD